MIQNKELHKFVDEMIRMLEEKRPKYQNAWKTMPFGELKANMDKQIESLSQFTTKRKYRRSLVHIAVYCGFLRNRMGE